MWNVLVECACSVLVVSLWCPMLPDAATGPNSRTAAARGYHQLGRQRVEIFRTTPYGYVTAARGSNLNNFRTYCPDPAWMDFPPAWHTAAHGPVATHACTYARLLVQRSPTSLHRQLTCALLLAVACVRSALSVLRAAGMRLGSRFAHISWIRFRPAIRSQADPKRIPNGSHLDAGGNDPHTDLHPTGADRGVEFGCSSAT